jgi:3-oxochol-4-en-24-oyl-CoA dehydrogenase
MDSVRDEFASSALQLLGRHDQVGRVRALRGTRPGFERSMWRTMAEAGWFAILVPEVDGGLGLGWREVCAIAEAVGSRLLPEPFVAAGVQSVAVLCQVPARPRRDALLRAISAGRVIAVVAWQEELAELEPSSPSMTAELRGDRLVLQGQKRFVVPGCGADGWLVTASSERGPLLLWLPADAAGLEVQSGQRFDGTLISTLVCREVSLQDSDLLCSGDAVIAGVAFGLDTARLVQAAELLGVARRALALSVDYLGTRVQFGQKIGSFQALAHRVVDAFIQVELADAGLQDALDSLGREPAGLALSASQLKARAAHAAVGMTRLAIQLHGAIGYTDEHEVSLLFKRALVLSSLLGGETAHHLRHRRLIAERAARSAAAAEHQRPLATSVAGVPIFPRDADWEAMPEPEFRRMVRGFLERHYPPALRHMPYRVHWPQIKEWYFTLARQGWIAPAWPKAFGGMELPADKLIAFIEEQEQYGVARPPDQGLIMLGPVLIRFGSKAQQRRYLPKILSGEHTWCQGYSEPNAGSDLAALSTEAVLDGDAFVVTGQKTWTTLAQDATHMFMLARTDKSGKKQHGISFLLCDLRAPGITIRPIRNIAGDEEFCEVFLDQVRVPADQLVGELHGGWTIAKTLLGFERLFGGSPKNSQHALGQLELLARARGLFLDPAFVARYAQLELDVADLSAAYRVFANIVREGGTLPPKVSLLKIWATETHERIAKLLVEAAAEYGGIEEQVRVNGAELRVLAPFINALAATIFSGSNEIQRNILARQVLGLPG